MGARGFAGGPGGGRGQAACALGARMAPHPGTVVRVLSALDAQGVARQARAYLAARAPGPATFPLAGPGPLPAVAVDGKAVCCASWTPITPWPGTHVITSDVGRTVKDHATLICGEILAHYVFTVKQNTPALWDELDALDWKAVPVQNATQEKGHGRRERRTIQVMKAPEHVAGYVRGQARNTRPFYTRA